MKGGGVEALWTAPTKKRKLPPRVGFEPWLPFLLPQPILPA